MVLIFTDILWFVVEARRGSSKAAARAEARGRNRLSLIRPRLLLLPLMSVVVVVGDAVVSD